MKAWTEHYREFASYCRTLTPAQLENVILSERERHYGNPTDACYAACYEAAKDERTRRQTAEAAA